jgi:hypothetical protein
MVHWFRRSTLLSLAIASLAWFSAANTFGAQAKPMSVAELALYKGADREKILLEGAKKEGQVVFYTSNTWVAGPVAQEFDILFEFLMAIVLCSD